MSRPTARGLAPAFLYEDEEDERVVYYDLDADSRRHNLLSSPDPASKQVAPRTTAAKARDRFAIALESSGSGASRAGGNSERAKEIFPRPHQPFFHLEVNATDGDAILDTEHQMRAEPFAAQIFSPTKLSAAGLTSGRKAKSDPITAKIRGDIGEAIRKALRKNNRDLTLLRSRGQHLLPQQSSRSAANHHFGAIESVQERPFVIICTDRRRAVTPHSVTYECHVHEVALEVKKRLPSVLDVGSSTPMQRLDVLFQLQTADYLKLGPGKLLKIYEPLHFVPRHMAPGSSNSGASKWFLISTQLAEVVEDVHRCSGGS
ncbi:hypothetical protein BBJ28_00013759 [Nothophytophthora sp. Chile5]|nr:hypothetical protein BBJ28_00013759 [Nothophytophthora sp. Chile5]